MSDFGKLHCVCTKRDSKDSAIFKAKIEIWLIIDAVLSKYIKNSNSKFIKGPFIPTWLIRRSTIQLIHNS
jgi:hypothetical protein